MDPNMVLAWHYYGGGAQLLEEIYKGLNLDVVSWVYGPMPTQPLGWFKKPIAKVEDLKGLKFRTVGLSIDIFTGLGMAVNALPGAEIVPAMDRGLLDAAEFNNASSDKMLGFADVSKVCMLQSFHQCSEQFEILFNRAKFNALPEDLRNILQYAMQAASADMSWKAIDRYSADYLELQQKHGVKFYKTPDPILRRQLEIWEGVIQKKSAENPMFKKVSDSMRAYAARAARWENDTNVDYRMAYNHFFAKKKQG
jgi:TRAP-type mannitol/chloroaromatic compound transport system substrate-binding protein